MGEIKKLDALIPTKYTGSLTAQLNKSHREIIEVKNSDTDNRAFDITGFKMAIVKIATEASMKDLPDELMTATCYQNYWLRKYAPIMSKQEFVLAFTMNLSGDLNDSEGKKVEHYQNFSPDFMCAVLNRYIEKRKEANVEWKKIETEQKVLVAPQPDRTPELLERIKKDYLAFIENIESDFLMEFTREMKLQILSELFDVDATEDNISGLRIVARDFVVKNLSVEKNRAYREKKFGRELGLTNQISRLRESKLILQKDEDLIQYEVRRLLIMQTFKKYPKDAFLKHINEAIESLKK